MVKRNIAIAGLSLMLAAAWLRGQPFTLRDPAFVNSLNKLAVAASGFYPTNIPNTLAFWNYRDAPIGNTYSWTDEVSSLVLTNWAVKTHAPTNTGMGWYFYKAGFTNTSMVSNDTAFSFWIVFCDVLNSGFARLVGNTAGTSNCVCLYSNSAVKQQLDFIWSGAANVPTNLVGMVVPNAITNQSLWTDLVYSEGNVYLNGRLTTANVGRPATNMVWQAMANDAAGNALTGYIKYFLVSTNHAITATEASNLWVWEQMEGVTNISDGCVAWYKCADAPNSTTLGDSSGNGYTLTNYGSPTWKGGLNSVVSNGIYYNGSSQMSWGPTGYPAVTNEFSNTHQCTISMWVSFNNVPSISGSWFGILDKTNMNFNYWSLFAKDSAAGIRASCGQTNVYNECGEIYISTNTAAAYAVTNWHHIVFASDGTNMNVWLDGFRQLDDINQTGAVQRNSLITATGWWLNLTNIFICGPNTTPFQNGTVTDLRIWNRLLNDAEVDILYRSPSADAILGAYDY